LPEFSLQHPHWTEAVLRRAKTIVAPSTYLANFFDKKGLSVHIIPNLIDIKEYPFRERKAIQPRLLWMRAFHPCYAPEMAVKVFAKLKEIHPQAILTMAGKDKGLLKKTQELVKENNLAESVRFPGFLAMREKTEAFARHDVFLNTSRIDNMPVSLIEVAAAGLPIVTTNAGGIADVFEHEKNALLVDGIDSVDDMVQGLQRLLREPDLACRLSRQARTLAEQSDIAAGLAQWKKILSNAI
jgi:glycosyltransferase involved in cell wall biosynthesis